MRWQRWKLWLGIKPKPKTVFATGGVVFHGHAVGRQSVFRDGMKMELLKAKMTHSGLPSADFDEIAERTIKQSRARDWSWQETLNLIEARCRDRLWGPISGE